MELQSRLERDLKTALLAGDKEQAETIRSLKNAIQYEAVALKIQKSKLTEEQIEKLFAKEAKKRQEAIDLYEKVGETERANSETSEKVIIEKYLPAKMSEAEIEMLVKDEIAKINNPTLADMGKIIGQVKGRAGSQSDGSVIAVMVKKALEDI